MPMTADSRTMFSLIVLTLVLLNSSFLISAGSSISCESMENNLSCEDGKTIHIHSANYGRTDNTTCSTGRPASQLAKNDCYTLNSKTIVANGCEGKGRCSILAANSVFSDPCVGTYKYLSISYSCLRSEIRSSISCESMENNLSCEDGKTIRIHSANYGRTDSTTCSTGRPASQLTKKDCYALNSQTIVVNGCEGKRRCSILAANSVFSDPCVGTYKYLSISYSCLRSEIRSSISCESMENNLSCEDGKTIHIHNANYGRTDSTTCSTGRPASQLAKNDCYAFISKTLVANGCEGKGRCSILAANSVFSDPCVGTYKYLSISYSCV